MGPVSGNREVWRYILYILPYYHLSYYTARLGEVSLSQEGLTAVLERMEVERTGELDICFTIKNDALPLKTMLLSIKMMLCYLRNDLIICLAAPVVPPWWKVFLRKIIV